MPNRPKNSKPKIDKKKPLIKVGKLTENDDGTSELEVEFSEKYKRIYAKEHNKKVSEVTEEELAQHFKELLKKSPEKNDGNKDLHSE